VLGRAAAFAPALALDRREAAYARWLDAVGRVRSRT
jgi:hypothetical protein